jgi:hypothetical protein
MGEGTRKRNEDGYKERGKGERMERDGEEVAEG